MATDSNGSTSRVLDVGGDRRDDLFGVLSHARRRFVLQYLRTTEPPASTDKLVTELVAWETRQPVAGRTNPGRRDIELSLVHQHLPKMDDTGLVEYDANGRTVAFVDDTSEARSHLRTMGQQ